MVFGPTVYDVPLLPFERELIATVGITEKEYREFVAEAKRRGAIRPAAYDNIPDVRATGTEAVLINLAISLVLTGVSYLLTPKPKMPAAQKSGGQIDLGSVTGSSRFTPSRGFETVAELADYASPIPLIFGLYKDGIGGMLTTPKLIWSRMFSHGTMQRAKLMFVVGEQGVGNEGIQPPELRGIFLGNNPLDAVFENLFAFYWHADSSTGDKFRIRGNDKIYGTRGKPHRGDPDAGNDDGDAFKFPLSNYEDEPKKIFCHTYTPSNSAQFGTYGAIANGTNYRVNYQLISIPKVDDKEQMARRTLERIKIVGESGEKVATKNGKKVTLREAGIDPGDASTELLNEIRSSGNHAGAGRNYSPRMGLVEAKGLKPGSNDYRLTVFNIEKGDRAKFIIRDSRIRESFYQKNGAGASVSDINSTVASLQMEADSAMQVGEHFEIGGCIWKVVSRNIQMFEPEKGEDQEIILECVDVSTSVNKRIGIVNETLVVNPGGDGNEFIGDSGVGDDSISVGEGFFPLTQISIATVKNNRPAVSTEIGLKSTVYQRLNGLCNFQSLPVPEELNRLEEKGIQVNNGTISTTIMRASVFRVFVRDVNSASDNFYAFPQFFVVRGQKPVAQYNFMRFTGERAAELEYKFVPVSGSELRDVTDSAEFRELSALESTNQNKNGSFGREEFTEVIPNIGTMKVEYNGQGPRSKNDYKVNAEFTRGYRKIAGSRDKSYPRDVIFVEASPEVQIGTTVEIGSSLLKLENIANAGITSGKLSAFFYEIAGTADISTVALGQDKKFTSLEYIDGDKKTWLHLEWTLTKKENPLTYAPSEFAIWTFKSVSVLGSGGGFSRRQKIEVKRGSEATDVVSGQSNYPSSNPFVSGHPEGTLKFSGVRLRVKSVTKDVELAARSQAWRYEVFGAIGNKSEGETKTVTETVTKGSRTIKVDLTSTVRVFAAPIVGQDKGWTIPKVTKVYATADTSKTWNVDDRFRINKSVSSSNPFKTVYNTVGQIYRIASINTENTVPDVEEAELFFSQQSQYVDISSYRGLVEKSNSTAPEHEIVYVNEVQINDSDANMLDLTIAGLSLKASRNFTALDQMRCWLASGIPVERLHPKLRDAYGDTNTTGPSNLFTDLVYFLLTDQMAGAGGLLGMRSDSSSNTDLRDDYLVDKDDLIKTSRFLERQKLFFNGPIVERTNLRQFISDTAPYFLCNFIITDGKFSLKPAIPVNDKGDINTGAVQFKQLFTAGNILEDSYKLEYLGAEERRAFKAVVRYRQERKNKFPEEQVVIVKGNNETDDFSSPGTDLLPSEQFDLTQFCTSKDHAVKVAKYFLALRRYVTHTISFSTTVEGLDIQAGSFIKVVTESSPYSSENTGTVSTSGVVTSVRSLPDATYTVSYFKTGSDDIREGRMTISNGQVAASEFRDIVFTIQSSTVSQNIYVVEQLTFSQEGTVDIVASEHPCNDDGSSKIAAFVDGTGGVTIQS